MNYSICKQDLRNVGLMAYFEYVWDLQRKKNQKKDLSFGEKTIFSVKKIKKTGCLVLNVYFNLF
jgi:hypothetical protein